MGRRHGAFWISGVGTEGCWRKCGGKWGHLVCMGAGCFSTGAVVERRITSSLSDFRKHPARCQLLRDSRLPAPSRYLLSGINLVLIHRRATDRALEPLLLGVLARYHAGE